MPLEELEKRFRAVFSKLPSGEFNLRAEDKPIKESLVEKGSKGRCPGNHSVCL
jgi:hypothetical protein